MAGINKLRLAFYGDDLTGSTDAMEALVLAGFPTVLFIEPPTANQIIERFPEIQAVGLAGMSRTMTPEEMDASLPSAFAGLKALGTPLTHYKVCSTFDSSPEIGSIGRAIEIGMQVFHPAVVPVAVGAPKLKRFVVFGNHFATLGGETYRLDRHPVMSQHPVTPMDESDLQFHLSKQTSKKVGLIDVHQLEQTDSVLDARLQEMIDLGIEVIILDTLTKAQLFKVGRLLSSLGQISQSFIVGSSGVEFALADYWQTEEHIQVPQQFMSSGPVKQIVAVSGSASPWTASQLKWAFEHGFNGIQLDSADLVDAKSQKMERNRTINQAIKEIKDGKSVILYSALGPDDPFITTTHEKIKSLGVSTRRIGEILGTQQGVILKEITSKTGLRRFAVAGGDTCGHVLKQLSVYVLEFIIPLGTAAPLCRASSYNPDFDGIEVSLKGGQLGDIDFFRSVQKGSSDLQPMSAQHT
jgi:uncharacterized protein YgbK (DUF1537 family)